MAYVCRKWRALHFRHSRAVHWLQAGVDLIYIRDLLGHVSVQTSEIYARVDGEMKRKALEKASSYAFADEIPSWQKDKPLMEWLKSVRTLPTKILMGKVRIKLQGHYTYYGVTDNSDALSRFAYEVRKILHKWLNRRGKRKCLDWSKFCLLLKRYPLPNPRIMVCLF